MGNTKRPSELYQIIYYESIILKLKFINENLEMYKISHLK